MVHHLSIFLMYIFLSSLIRTISTDKQSFIDLSSIGLKFSPTNQAALLLSTTNTDSLVSCAEQCHSNIQCRIFNYDSQYQLCQLFQGNISTMGSIIPSSSSSYSCIGSIQIYPEYYVNYGESCSQCMQSRYLQCTNESCQCPLYTYFDGSICQSQKISGNDCNSSIECRNDLNYTCLPRMQCALASIQTATLSAGKPNGGSGSGLSALYGPAGIFLANDNSLYVADYENHRIIKFVEGSLNGSIVAGTGNLGSSLSQLNQPTSVYVDESYNIYISDSLNYRIIFWQNNATVGIIVAGNGSSGSTLNTFGSVNSLTVDSQGNIYVCDTTNHRIMKFSPNVTNGVIVAGITGSSGNAVDQLDTPYGIYLDELNSYLYVADYNNHRIQRFHLGISTNGTTVAGGNGVGLGKNQLFHPYSVYVSKTTNAIYIADSDNSRVQRWNSQSTYGVPIAGKGTLSTNTSTQINFPTDVKLNINETSLFVSQMLNNRVWRFTLV